MHRSPFYSLPHGTMLGWDGTFYIRSRDYDTCFPSVFNISPYSGSKTLNTLKEIALVTPLDSLMYSQRSGASSRGGPKASATLGADGGRGWVSSCTEPHLSTCARPPPFQRALSSCPVQEAVEQGVCWAGRALHPHYGKRASPPIHRCACTIPLTPRISHQRLCIQATVGLN